MNNFFQIIQNNVKEMNLPSTFVYKLYKMVKRQETHEDAYTEGTNFIGRITVSNTYQEYIDAINIEFPLLEIIADGIYVLFEDDEVCRILANQLGDGVGITIEQMQNIRAWQRTWFYNNTIIETFDEFNKCVNLRTIADRSFYRCTSLKRIDISNIENINIEVFYQDTALETVYAPNVTTIGSSAFVGCTALNNATFTNVTTIANMAFKNCLLSNADFGNNIISIGESAFDHTEIEDIDLSNTTTLSQYAFANCQYLTNIHSDLSQVTSIGAYTFSGCKLLSNDLILTNLTSIPNRTFATCEKIKNITMANVTSVGSYSFCYCYGLTNVNAINLTSIGECAFVSTSQLSSALFTSAQTIGNNAFEGSNLSNANFGNNITQINNFAFKNTNLQHIDLSNCTNIGKEAFLNCKQLTSIGTDLSNATVIGESAFYNCENLTGDFVLTNIITLSSQAFKGTKITSIDLSNVTTFSSWAYGGIFQGCKSLHTVILNPNVKSLPPYIFNGCTSLINIDISNIEEFIFSNDQAGHFTNCSSLRSITLNNNLTSLPARCFYGCSSLTSVTIPASVTYIGTEQFKNCTGLQSMTILATTPPELYTYQNGHTQIFNYPNTYPIYVPAESVELYKTTEYWSYYANRIQAIPTT